MARDEQARRDRDRELLHRCLEEPGLLEMCTAHDVGRLGEELALVYLEERGYTLMEQNYQCQEGEADLIVYDTEGEEVVLVEVKTRRGRAGTRDLFPELAVDERKRQRYARIAARYVLDNFPVYAIRFDVVAITLRPGPYAEIEHLCGAYEWDSEQ